MPETVKQLCFMVMPYGRKPSQAEPGKGPVDINFDALWDRAFFPVILELGYEPVRADQDLGALIIKEMLERLYFSDLVLADMTIPNGNVYYEVGVRHAARERGCVLLAAEWSRQLFDVAQMRMIRYPLPDGDVTGDTAQAVRAAIRDGIEKLKDGRSPMHDSLPGFPSAPSAETALTMRRQMEALSAFQARVRAVRAAPRADRMALASQLVDEHRGQPLSPIVAITLMRTLVSSVEQRDDWRCVLDLIDGLPASIRQQAEVGEQRALALSEIGQPADSIGALEELIRASGPTPERLGLLGGRYKRLMKAAATPGERQQYLARAIESYEQGTNLDLNEYYCSSNLPRLYRERGRKGDEERAQATLHLVVAACDRAMRRGVTDEWLRPTLLGAAFDVGDADKAEELADAVATEGAARWKLDSTLADLERSVKQATTPEPRGRLSAVLQQLKALVEG